MLEASKTPFHNIRLGLTQVRINRETSLSGWMSVAYDHPYSEPRCVWCASRITNWEPDADDYVSDDLVALNVFVVPFK